MDDTESEQNVALATSPINSPESSSSTSTDNDSSSGDDETVAKGSTKRDKKRKNRKTRVSSKRQKSRKTATVTMAPLSVQKVQRHVNRSCGCNCREKIKQLTTSVIKIKQFLRQNYCTICGKAGHNVETCRRRPRPTLDFD